MDEAQEKQRTAQRKKLLAAMKRANGKPPRGRLCKIMLAVDGESCKYQLYLSGVPYLFSAFSERACEIGERQARDWIKRYPLVLAQAEVKLWRWGD